MNTILSRTLGMLRSRVCEAVEVRDAEYMELRRQGWMVVVLAFLLLSLTEG